MKLITSSVALCLAVVALAGNALVDEALLSKAEVVLRVRWLSSEGGDKYLWDRVQVLSVLKNTSSERFEGVVAVAAYSWGAGGVPEGESTLYLERYNEGSQSHWKLLGGDASQGVSHVKLP